MRGDNTKQSEFARSASLRRSTRTSTRPTSGTTAGGASGTQRSAAPSTGNTDARTRLFHSPSTNSGKRGKRGRDDEDEHGSDSDGEYETDEQAQQAHNTDGEQEEEEDDEEEDDGDAYEEKKVTKPARNRPARRLSKEAKSARRREQNRRAQRALRERKEARLMELEELLEQQLGRQKEIEKQKRELQDLVAQLRKENEAYRAAAASDNMARKEPSASNNHIKERKKSSEKHSSKRRKTIPASPPPEETNGPSPPACTAAGEAPRNTRLHIRAAKAGLLPIGDLKLDLTSATVNRSPPDTTVPAIDTDPETLAAASNLCNLAPSPNELSTLRVQERQLQLADERDTPTLQIGANFRSSRHLVVSEFPAHLALVTPSSIDENVLGLFESSQATATPTLPQARSPVKTAPSPAFATQSQDHYNAIIAAHTSRATPLLADKVPAGPSNPEPHLHLLRMHAPGAPVAALSPTHESPTQTSDVGSHGELTADNMHHTSPPARPGRSSTFASVSTNDGHPLTPNEVKALSEAQSILTNQRKVSAGTVSIATTDTSESSGNANSADMVSSPPHLELGTLLPNVLVKGDERFDFLAQPPTSLMVDDAAPRSATWRETDLKASTAATSNFLDGAYPLVHSKQIPHQQQDEERFTHHTQSQHPHPHQQQPHHSQHKPFPQLPTPGNPDLRPFGEDSYAGFAFTHRMFK